MRKVIAQMNTESSNKLPTPGVIPDRGFRVFKLAESNLKPWDADGISNDLSKLQSQLDLHINHIRDGRSAEGILTELLLKSGFPSQLKSRSSLSAERMFTA